MYTMFGFRLCWALLCWCWLGFELRPLLVLETRTAQLVLMVVQDSPGKHRAGIEQAIMRARPLCRKPSWLRPLCRKPSWLRPLCCKPSWLRPLCHKPILMRPLCHKPSWLRPLCRKPSWLRLLCCKPSYNSCLLGSFECTTGPQDLVNFKK